MSQAHGTIVHQTAQFVSHEENSKAKVPEMPSKVSTANRPSRLSNEHRHEYRTSFAQSRSSKVPPSTDFKDLVFTMSEAENRPPTFNDLTDFKSLTNYFLRLWKAPHAANALIHLEKLETKRTVRALQRVHGYWQPPPEVADAMKKNPPTSISNFPDNKESRNLKFVLKILGCALPENKPYKQFLKAKTLPQKRNWLYKYQGPSYKTNPSYKEPVCPTRLKRLYHFFPDRFSDKEGFMYFNDKVLSYDEGKNVFYIGKELDDE